MISSSLQHIFSLAATHTYFEKNVCKCLRFKPGPATRALQKRFGLERDDHTGGFDFYVDTMSPVQLFLDHISNVTGYSYFDFDIETIAPAFYFFTELPPNWLGQLVYDSQYALNTTDGQVMQLAANLVPGGSTQGLGTLTIHFADIVKQTAGACAQFGISYAARATQWQYFVVNKGALTLDNPTIAGKAGINFEGPESVTIPSGQQALLFTSGSNLIPLSEHPRYKFDLVHNPAGNGHRPSVRTIVRGLPGPAPWRIGSTLIGANNQCISSMYVYL